MLPSTMIVLGLYYVKQSPCGFLTFINVYEFRFCIFQEFECGVSVAGSDKQEWSFTLYDFDGKGKITKEVGYVPILRLSPKRI